MTTNVSQSDDVVRQPDLLYKIDNLNEMVEIFQSELVVFKSELAEIKDALLDTKGAKSEELLRFIRAANEVLVSPSYAFMDTPQGRYAAGILTWFLARCNSKET